MVAEGVRGFLGHFAVAVRQNTVGGLVFIQQFAFALGRFERDLAAVDRCSGCTLTIAARQVVQKATADAHIGAAVIDQVPPYIEHVNPGFVGGVFDIRLSKGNPVSMNRHCIFNSSRLVEHYAKTTPAFGRTETRPAPNITNNLCLFQLDFIKS